MLCAKSVPYRYTHTEAQLMVGDNSRDEDYLGNCSEKPVISSTYCAHKSPEGRNVYMLLREPSKVISNKVFRENQQYPVS